MATPVRPGTALAAEAAMSVMTGQIVLVGTAEAEGFDPRIAKGCRCATLSVLDCDRLQAQGLLARYDTGDGLDAGALLDDTLGVRGWTRIAIRAALPVADVKDGWEPELQALIATARALGVAHMVFEPMSERPHVVH
jgi:hypothetical protein